MKLTYFNIRGLAETSRILLAIMGQEYEDFRYPLNIIDLASFNMEKPEFDAAKQDGKLLGSLNKVPFLERMTFNKAIIVFIILLTFVLILKYNPFI